MAMYTMQLRVIIEKYSQYDSNLSLDEKIEMGRQNLFNFDYPFFDENYRKIFERNIIREFYMREIGFETEGLFKMRLSHWLNVNMPYFNKLFESELLDYDPLTNSKMDVTHSKSNDKEQNDIKSIETETNTHGTGSSDSTQKGEFESSKSSSTQNEGADSTFKRSIEGDTPQDRLQLTTGSDGDGVIEYASNINEDKTIGNSESSSVGESVTENDEKIDISSSDETNVDSSGLQDESLNSTINEMENFVQSRVGKIGVQSYGKLITDYREALLRIEVQIHKEMQQLFMLVY